MFGIKKKKKKNDHLYGILEEIKREREDIFEFIKNYNTNKPYCSFQSRPCTTIELFTWEKDSEGRYISANERHCTKLFHLVTNCIEGIKGKKDTEITKSIIDQGVKHTFGKMCELTDEKTKDMMETCRFVEIGYINNEYKILDTTKTPIIIDDEFVGTKGLAFDITDKSEMIKGGIDQGWLCLLTKNHENAAYMYKKTDEIDFFENNII